MLWHFVSVRIKSINLKIGKPVFFLVSQALLCFISQFFKNKGYYQEQRKVIYLSFPIFSFSNKMYYRTSPPLLSQGWFQPCNSRSGSRLALCRLSSAFCCQMKNHWNSDVSLRPGNWLTETQRISETEKKTTITTTSKPLLWKVMMLNVLVIQTADHLCFVLLW